MTDPAEQSRRGVPSLLFAYIVFAIAITITDWLIIVYASDSLRSRLVPFTGWVASMFYAFTIYIAIALIFVQRKRMYIRFGITAQLVLSIAFGIFQLFQITGKTFGNPYLTVSPWRPVWTILIPGIWIVLLHLPSMNRFCGRSGGAHAAQETSPHSAR